MLLNTLLLFAFLFKPRQGEVHESIYDFKVTTLDGSVIHLSDFKGRKILIVNTASKCKFTHQYEALEQLYLSHKGKLVIIGFPSNNFFYQEPGDNKKIAAFCTKNYGVTFPMSEKISVKGKNIAPIYTWLTRKKYNHFEDSRVKWNFQKYLIDEQGKLVAVFDPNTPPDSPEVLQAIEK